MFATGLRPANLVEFKGQLSDMAGNVHCSQPGEWPGVTSEEAMTAWVIHRATGRSAR